MGTNILGQETHASQLPACTATSVEGVGLSLLPEVEQEARLWDQCSPGMQQKFDQNRQGVHSGLGGGVPERWPVNMAWGSEPQEPIGLRERAGSARERC